MNKLIIFVGVVAYLVLLPACGPLTPHVDVQASGSVNTSGTITVNLPELTSVLTNLCNLALGVKALPSDISQCINTNYDSLTPSIK